MRHYPWHAATEQLDEVSRVGLGVVSLESDPESRLAARGSCVVAFDGELYDADRERDRIGASAVGIGPEDAALFLAGWQTQGEAFLQRLHGLFSAVIWDADCRTLTIVTDRFGMRPLYVAETPARLFVASEIKTILVDADVRRTWSEEGVAQFMAFGHFFGDRTLFDDIRAVPAGTCATYSLDARRFEWRQYIGRPSRSNVSSPDDTIALVTALDDALTAAVSRRAQPGEHLGLSLSGGLDARTLLGLMPAGRDVKTVSIGIQGSIDHRGAAELARLAGVPHHEYYLDASFLSGFERHLREMVRLTDGHYLDQGIVMTTLPMYRELGIDYLLRGHGGELLHMRKAYAFSLDGRALRATDAELEAWLFEHVSGYMLSGVPDDLFTVDVRGLARQSMRQALERTTASDAPVDRVWPVFLNERLHRETALSMHKFGCFATVRMPFIDNDVIDALLALPAGMKLGDELQARILRHRRPDFIRVVNSNTGAAVGASPFVNYVSRLRMRIAAKLGVKGYQPYERLGLWLRQELRPFVESVLLGERFSAHGLFRPDAVRRVVGQHMNQEANHTFLIMSLLIFGLGQEMLADPEAFVGETS